MTTYQNDRPYVGPVPFTTGQAGLFFGRETEAKFLLSRVITERVVLFHAVSGAGKSSLINARIIPELEKRGFQVLPLVRVGLDLPSNVKLKEEIPNIFVFNTLRSLVLIDPKIDTVSSSLKTKTLKEGVMSLLLEEKLKIPHWIIFDQFEELLTTNLDRWNEREGFFKQLQEVLDADSKLSVIIVIREDFVAQLDRYVHLLKGQLRIRFNMERLSQKSAIDAIKLPAEKAGKPFEDGVSERLVKDLSRMKSVNGFVYQGEFIEPVCLQVVCLQLWEKVKYNRKTKITMTDLAMFGNPNEALESFYSEAIKRISNDPQVLELLKESEPAKIESIIRRWFQQKLIIQSNGRDIRAQVGKEGLSEHILIRLLNEHLIRREEIRGGEWYELAHDRFVSPVKSSNEEWFYQFFAHPSIEQAKEWKRNYKASELLLSKNQFDAANHWFDNYRVYLDNDTEQLLADYLKQSEDYFGVENKQIAVKRLNEKMILSFIILVGMVTIIFLLRSYKEYTINVRVDKEYENRINFLNKKVQEKENELRKERLQLKIYKALVEEIKNNDELPTSPNKPKKKSK